MLFISSLAAVVFLGPQEFAAFFKDLRFASAQFSNILFSKQIDYFALKKIIHPCFTHGHWVSRSNSILSGRFSLFWPINFPTRKIYIVLMAVMIVGLGLSEYLVQTNALHAFICLIRVRGNWPWEALLPLVCSRSPKRKCTELSRGGRGYSYLHRHGIHTKAIIPRALGCAALPWHRQHPLRRRW